MVRHGHHEYVRGPIFTSTVEGFFGNVKNGIAGNYHGVSRRWLQGYVNEYAWRLSHRDDRRGLFVSSHFLSRRTSDWEAKAKSYAPARFE